MPLLEVYDLVKRFPGAAKATLDGVRFRVEDGEIFGLLGPSGCGKTTTLRAIAGFETCDGGSIRIHDRDIVSLKPEARGIGMVFQDYALFHHLTVEKNILFALRSLPKPERSSRLRSLLDLLDLGPLAKRFPHELSGGQQQRVAIARALAARPALLLMDEPFSNLDAALRDVTRREIRWTLKRARVNAVLVTHDQEEALSFCDRLAVMNAGRIEQEGKPEEVYFRPKTPFVAQFLGRSNMLRGKAFGSTAETPLGRISIFPETRGDVLLSVRPEHVLLTPPGSSTSKVHGVVVSREFRGHDSTFRFRCGDGMYLSHMEYTRDFSPGDPVAIEVREAGTVLGREPVGFNIGTNPTNS